MAKKNTKKSKLSANVVEYVRRKARDTESLDLGGKLDGELSDDLMRELGGLKSLTTLYLGSNQLTELPESIGGLKSLTTLRLNSNQLTELPESIGGLKSLTTLLLGGNQLTELPESIGGLKSLTTLDLDSNQLTELPESIGGLKSLTTLRLNSNPIFILPPELSELEALSVLELDHLEFLSPPPEVVSQGLDAIKAFLREHRDLTEQWVSKLLVVGEGGVGKTCLLRALRGESFLQGTQTTHGVKLGVLELRHREKDDVTMILNTWDFGGQQIYHATHQFFLTNRSLFLLAWNARIGYEQSKLYYWLDTIHSLAPDSPVLLIATYGDERAATLPIDDIRSKYCNVVFSCTVSNKTGDGIAKLKDELCAHAASLPLMGEKWPSAWLSAANAMRDLELTHVLATDLRKSFADHGVTEPKSQDVLATWLHELGDILYFAEDDELKDLVLLDPQWVTEQISKVLEYRKIIEGLGIFRHEHVEQVWKGIEAGLREKLLRLMELFDLSYRIPDDPDDKSIVVERVQLNAPEYQEDWEGIRRRNGCKEISMRFDLQSTRPAGATTWFIAREHRFTLNTHWRFGALFGDARKNWKRLALVDSPPRRTTWI